MSAVIAAGKRSFKLLGNAHKEMRVQMINVLNKESYFVSSDCNGVTGPL